MQAPLCESLHLSFSVSLFLWEEPRSARSRGQILATHEEQLQAQPQAPLERASQDRLKNQKLRSRRGGGGHSHGLGTIVKTVGTVIGVPCSCKEEEEGTVTWWGCNSNADNSEREAINTLAVTVNWESSQQVSQCHQLAVSLFTDYE